MCCVFIIDLNEPFGIFKISLKKDSFSPTITSSKLEAKLYKLKLGSDCINRVMTSFFQTFISYRYCEV